MHLVMFDIDGTLTETMAVDTECFVRSFAEVWGMNGIDTDWSRYRHTTDAGIVEEIYLARTGRVPSEAELSRFRAHFLDLLTVASSQSPFVAIAGAGPLLTRLARSSTHRVSLATGAWRESARLKMASAGMSYDDHPAASSDDAPDRESIMRISLNRAVERHGGEFESMVYVGDAVWDARACRALGVPFIGVGSGERAQRLAAEGAVRVIPDFSEGDRFMEILQETVSAA